MKWIKTCFGKWEEIYLKEEWQAICTFSETKADMSKTHASDFENHSIS